MANGIEYSKFLMQIQKMVNDSLSEQNINADVYIQKVTKNNNTEFMALVIHTPGEAVSPQIYLDSFFAQCQKGKAIEEIAAELISSYAQNKDFELSDVKGFVTDFEKVQEFLRVQLINKEFNSEKLQHTPHRDFENTDLTAVLRIHLPTQEHGEATILVSDALYSHWNKSMEELYPLALHNTMEANPAKIIRMLELVKNMFSDNCIGEDIKNFQMEPYEQYVLSNSTSVGGATVLLYPEVMEHLAQGAGANFFILPSSIHESILILDTGEMDAKELQAMVMSVNQTNVSPEERLSDEVYYYDREEHCLSMATGREATQELKEQLRQAGDNSMERPEELER